MERVLLDAYVLDVLMPDLVGHDRRPAAFIVYLYLLRHAARLRRDAVAVSLQTIATHTGLSKSAVQAALRHLKRRRLVDPEVAATVTQPTRQVLRPWAKAARRRGS
jgi:DNA-binding IclR family transcriptional regulator